MCVVSATTRPNWREERKLNVETFGARSASMYGRRGGYRGGRYRGGRGMHGAPFRGILLLKMVKVAHTRLPIVGFRS